MPVRRLVVLAGALAAIALGALVWTGGPLTDLAPNTVHAPDAEAEARGRALLEACAEAHGVEALAAHTSWTLEATDTWVGLGTWFNPWPDAAQTFRMTADIHTFDSEVAMLNGAEQGVTWGITDGRTRRRGAIENDDHDASIAFMLPTMHYFVEMPQRITEIPIVRSLGRQTVRGQEYEVVFGTWSSTTANRDFDQYLLYLDPETHHLRKAHYTVREMAGFAEGVMHFDDLHTVEGFTVPLRMTVTSAVDTDPAADFMHQAVTSSFRFDG